jgi:soluble lytic murein transglycosylase-like protein
MPRPSTHYALYCRFARIGLAVLLCGIGATAQAQIYGGVDAEGALVLTNVPSEQDMQVVVAAPPAPPVAEVAAAAPSGKVKGEVPGTSPAIRAVVAEAAKLTAVDPALLHAVIKVESGYNARAVSRKGAQGLMQLMPDTARRLGVANPFSPRDNVLGGARYLRELLDLFDQNVELAVAAYNAGENAVIRAGYRTPPYSETQHYVPQVLRHFREYARYM